MEHIIFSVIAVFYLLSFGCAVATRIKYNPRPQEIGIYLERVGFVLFTAGLIFYAYQIENQTTQYSKPLVWLTFAWALSAANFVTDLLYNNRATNLFTSIWIALVLTILPLPHAIV